MEINNNIPESSSGTQIPRRRNWIKCDVCNIYVTSNKLLELHIKGKKHLIVARKIQDNVSDYRCHVCNVRVNGKKQLEEHISGKAHKMKITELQEKDEFQFYLLYGTVLIMLLYIIISYTLYALFNFF